MISDEGLPTAGTAHYPRPANGFALPVGDGLKLVLSEAWTAAQLHALILSNLAHLQP